MEEVPRAVADDLDHAAVREKGSFHGKSLPSLAMASIAMASLAMERKTAAAASQGSARFGTRGRAAEDAAKSLPATRLTTPSWHVPPHYRRLKRGRQFAMRIVHFHGVE